MRNKNIQMLITTWLIALVLILPIQLRADDPVPVNPDPQHTALAICVIACAALAAGGVYILSKRCQPKYYWLWDGEQPPRTWVGAATDKECAINGWTKIGGPYEKAADAPPTCPDLTNRVQKATSAPMNIAVEGTSNMSQWSTVYAERCDMDDFGAFIPNTNSFRFYRIVVTP